MVRLIAIAALGATAAACGFNSETRDAESGPDTTRSWDVSQFERVEVSGPYDVDVTTGQNPAVSAKGSEKLLDRTEVLVKDGVLVIRPKKDGMRWSWKSGTARFKVGTPMLGGARIAGSGSVDVDRVEGDFYGSIAGSGDLRVADLSAGKTSMEIAGSGDIRYAGTADEIRIEIAGSGDADASALEARTGSVDIAGSGDASANISESAKVRIAGSGDVRIKGGAQCSVRKIGSGDVRCD